MSLQVITIPNGVDRQALTPRRGRDVVRQELGVSRDAAVSVSLAALVPEKDPLGVIELLVPYLCDRPDAVHLFVGAGPLMHDVEARAAALLPAGRVRCLGERYDVADILGAADLLVFASPPGGMEGMPASAVTSSDVSFCPSPVKSSTFMIAVPSFGFAAKP